MANDAVISERLERFDEIIEQLDADDCDREEGGEIYEKDHQLLVETREILRDDSGDVVELE